MRVVAGRNQAQNTSSPVIRVMTDTNSKRNRCTYLLHCLCFFIFSFDGLSLTGPMECGKGAIVMKLDYCVSLGCRSGRELYEGRGAVHKAGHGVSVR